MSQPTPSQTNFTDRDFSTDSIHNHASLDATKSYVEMEQARLEREKMTDNIDGRRDAEDIFDEFNEQLWSQANHVFSLLSSKLKRLYGKATDAIDDEFSIPVSQTQINDALAKFVTKNVKQILEIRVELHEDWFRLYCTVEASGVYTEVASNFGLVHAQLDRDVQRFVFAQQTYTDILSLHCDSFIKRLGIKAGVWFYHNVLKKDPLGVILQKINIAKPKDNILYLDIGRWLKKNKKIMTALHKAQVNYGILEEEQMVLKTQVNVRDLIGNASGEDLITPDDEPEIGEGSLEPIDAAVEPSHA